VAKSPADCFPTVDWSASRVVLSVTIDIWGREMTSSTGHKIIVLGDEYDDMLRKALLDTVREFTAQHVDHEYGVGGSQEIERFEIEIEGERIEVVSETYLGLSIAGNE